MRKSIYKFHLLISLFHCTDLRDSTSPKMSEYRKMIFFKINAFWKESKYKWQFGNLPRRGWGKVGARLRHGWGTKLKFRGHAWGKRAWDKVGAKLTWGKAELMTCNCLGQAWGIVGDWLGHKTEIPEAWLAHGRGMVGAWLVQGWGPHHTQTLLHPRFGRLPNYHISFLSLKKLKCFCIQLDKLNFWFTSTYPCP